MPATSSKQRNTALMARAVKHGKKSLKDMPPGARKAVQSMMQMADESLEHYSHMARKKRR